METDCLVVEYDCAGDDDRVTSARILFKELLTFEYWDSSCCPAENILPPTEVRVLDQSEYLDRIRSVWDERVGWQEWQKKQGGSSRFKHFTVYFDDAGSLDVIAARCSVDS